MPIYEYVCQQCGHELDALQKMSDAPLRDCPACQVPALKKAISAPNFRLKGQGWYETDFKSDKDKKRNLADSPGSTDGASSGSVDGKSADKSADKKIDKSAGKSDTKTAAATTKGGASKDGGKAA